LSSATPPGRIWIPVAEEFAKMLFRTVVFPVQDWLTYTPWLNIVLSAPSMVSCHPLWSNTFSSRRRPSMYSRYSPWECDELDQASAITQRRMRRFLNQTRPSRPMITMPPKPTILQSSMSRSSPPISRKNAEAVPDRFTSRNSMPT
jgi:hypothetical protein